MICNWAHQNESTQDMKMEGLNFKAQFMFSISNSIFLSVLPPYLSSDEIP